MFSIVYRLMVIFAEQVFQHLHRNPSVMGMGVLAAFFHEVSIGIGDIATAGITHGISSPNLDGARNRTQLPAACSSLFISTLASSSSSPEIRRVR